VEFSSKVGRLMEEFFWLTFVSGHSMQCDLIFQLNATLCCIFGRLANT